MIVILTWNRGLSPNPTPRPTRTTLPALSHDVRFDHSRPPLPLCVRVRTL